MNALFWIALVIAWTAILGYIVLLLAGHVLLALPLLPLAAGIGLAMTYRPDWFTR